MDIYTFKLTPKVTLTSEDEDKLSETSYTNIEYI
jgi:hypothetical protein